MTVDSGTNRWRIFDAESEQGFRQFKDRVYPAGQDATLSDMSMQEGDTLPDDSTYEIISSAIEMVKPLTTATGKHNGGRAATLRGMKERVETPKTGNGEWSELDGTRQVDDSDPQVLRYQIKFTADVADTPTRPSNGDTYLTITGNASGFVTTGLDREPVAVSVGETVKATILKSHVTVVFQAHYARTSTGSPFTEINPRQRTLVGKNSWRGRRRFSVPVVNAVSLEHSLFGSIFPGLSGKFAAKCNRVETHDKPPNMPGRSLVIADYETPRVIGEGVLRIELGTEKVVETTDLLDKIIIGPELVPGKTKKYHERRIISGSNIRLVPSAIIILETAATSFNLNSFIDRVGHVNKYRLPNFGNAQPGTLLFLGAPRTTFRLVGNLWYLNLAFKYSGNPKKYKKWNERLVSVSGNYVPRQLPGVDKDGALVTGSTKWQLEWVPNKLKTAAGVVGEIGKPNDPHTHAFYPKSDFRDLGRDLIVTGI